MRALTSCAFLVTAMMMQDPAPEAPEPCQPCGGSDHAGLALVKLKLEEAFRLTLTAAGCSGAESRETCIEIETRLEEAFGALRNVVRESEDGGAIDCVSCDPEPHIKPLIGSFEAVANLLFERGHEDFLPKLRPMQQELSLWSGYGCCQAQSTRKRSTSREMEARTSLLEKCGQNFERNRAGLRQVIRIPDDREGCYQSRACRDATEYQGRSIEAGFWTYDGEYWYIWGERRTPRGDWTTCKP